MLFSVWLLMSSKFGDAGCGIMHRDAAGWNWSKSGVYFVSSCIIPVYLLI